VVRIAAAPKTLLVVVALAFVATSCRREEESVLLRYAPQVGHTYRYQLEIRRPHDPIQVTGDMKILGRGQDGYQIQFSGVYPDELFSEPMTVSKRHNSSHPGYVSLNFPDGPVPVGGEWRGEIPWYFENDYVLDPPEMRLPASYKLLAIEDERTSRRAVIEQSVEANVAVDGLVLHVGQVGVGWDHEGRITEVHKGYDAFGRLAVGDVVVGINGERPNGSGGLQWLAEKHIQRPRESATIRFSVLRGGEPHEIEVEKTIDQLAVVNVHNVTSTLTATFDVDRGILLSAEASIGQEDVAFTSPTGDPFPIVDDYGGFHKFGYLRGRTVYQTSYGSDGVAWTLTLVE
jgi:hypothetical protein